jgi:arylsulfatase A-like enzyme
LLACATPVAVFGGRSPRTWLWTVVIALGGGLLFSRLQDSLPAPLPVGDSPNGPASVVVLTIDTLRADALSCYQPGLGDTPNIDQLARDGALFRQAYSPASWTIPSMTSLFTGAAPLVHGVSQPVPDATLPTMADYFLGAGYDTVGVFGNPVLTNQRVLVRNAELRAYFDVYHGFRILRLFHSNLLGETYAAHHYGQRRGLDGERGANTAGLADLTIERIRAHGDGPLFLWTHFYDPHGPFAPVEELIPTSPPQPPGIGTNVGTFNARFGTVYFKPEQRPWVRALYQAETRYVDAAVGRILDALRQAGAYDDALIVLTSDHGEQFWEHGRVGHGNSLHREAVLVPLIVKAPRARPGRVIETPVENRALLPTMLELAGIPHEAQAFWTPSLVPLLQGTGGYGDGAAIVTSGVELFEDEAAIRVGNLRLIRMLYSGHESLFDLSTDPGEMHSILHDRPDDAERMRRALDHHLGESQRLRQSLGLTENATQPFDDETLRRLKSLGYL